MNITLKAKLLSIKPVVNKQTGEQRFMLSFLDTDGETPEVINLKAPQGLNVTELKKDFEYVCTLLIWKMGERFGFYIPSPQDIQVAKA